jgi:hypothetical protein
LWTAAWKLRKRCADPADLNRLAKDARTVDMLLGVSIGSRRTIMDRHPEISAFLLFLVGILPAGPASQAAAAQVAAASLVATGDFSGSILAVGNCIWSAAAMAAPR